MPQPAIVAPPPWSLTGNGYIFLYRFPADFVRENGFLAPYQAHGYRGLLGAVMFVDYHTTPVGPYKELLFIPGLFKLGGRRTFSISKIYVSSSESVWNGIQNWGIPKELADFAIETIDDHTQRLVARHNSEPFFEVVVQKNHFSFPINAALFPLKITQQLGSELIMTKPSAKGKASFGKILDLKINSAYFPNLEKLKPIAVLAVTGFEMGFPVPERN